MSGQDSIRPSSGSSKQPTAMRQLLVAAIFAAVFKLFYCNGEEASPILYRDDVLKFSKRPVRNSVHVSRREDKPDAEDSSLDSMLVTADEDKEQTHLQVISDENQDGENPGSLEKRPSREPRIFFFQRLLNGVHLLALLAGIVMMIFVMDPVPLPPEVLQPHYFGLPWSSEKREAINLPHLPQIIRKAINHEIPPSGMHEEGGLGWRNSIPVTRKPDGKVSVQSRSSHNGYIASNPGYHEMTNNRSEKRRMVTKGHVESFGRPSAERRTIPQSQIIRSQTTMS